MQKIKAFVPHLFTLGNLFCGCLGIIYAFAWRLDWAAYMVFLAAFLDFFDGFFARILKVPSELGKQLDSLADVVSFGVVPGMVMFQWLKTISFYDMVRSKTFFGFMNTSPKGSFEMPWYCYIALMIALFSCYRLAKFNLDSRQSNGFIGLPTPANAIFFCSLLLLVPPFIYSPLANELDIPVAEYTIYPPLSNPLGEYISTATRYEMGDSGDFYMSGEMLDQPIGESWHPPHGIVEIKMNSLFSLLLKKYVILGLIVLFSILLVSELPLFALKFKNFGWNSNKIRYLFLTLATGLLICFWLTAIPFIVILYLILSILNNIFKITV